ncbi:hypothetical protein [Pimelobacter simplex]|uniref:hypothetical protein n=1 Tax=Nocardioides simplex TaxID=2045 RepID=UPI003AABB1E7
MSQTLAIIAGVVVVAFITLGLVWAFTADRRRNEEVAHDPERLDTDPRSEPEQLP